MMQIEVARSNDLGANDKTFIVNTHLGDVLSYYDTVLAYDLESMNLEQLEDLELQGKTVPSVVIVRKTYPKFRKRQKHRIWKLKQLNKEEIDENNIHRKKGDNKNDRDKDIFMRDIEEDPDVRTAVDLYRVK